MSVPQISQANLATLHEFAEPFEDLNDVLSRVIEEVRRHRTNCTLEPAAAPGASPSPGPASRRKKKRAKTLTVLLDARIVEPGTPLVLSPSRFPETVNFDADERRFRCRISPNPRSRNNVIWEGDGYAYPLSRVTEMLRDRDELPFISGALNGFGWWALESDPSTTLWELAEQVGR
jgi:hypothetical protein